MTEGTISRWLKAEGDEIEKDEPLCEIDTDKVNSELPSPFAGRIERLLIPEGTTVDVGTEIALVVLDEAQGATPEDGEHTAGRDGEAGQENEEFSAARADARSTGDDGERRALVGARSDGDGRGGLASAETLRLTRSSPVVRRLAQEHDVDIAEIPGTGIGGRVTKKDIEAYIEEREEEVAAPGLREKRETLAPPEAPWHDEAAPARDGWQVEVYEGDRVVDLTSIRRAIADRMSRSKHEAPHAWSMVEADVTGLVGLRERVKEEFQSREGFRLTYLPFIAKAVAEGLKEHPVLNSVWDGDRILLRKRINLGVAVDLEDALIVPVIPDADELNILGLARKIDDLVRRARSGRLRPGDVAGGTFTVNNPGALGSVVSVPIINHPQAAILSAEAIVKRPVVVDYAIAIRSMMNLGVSFDHRIFDGGTALRFLNSVKRRLEGYRVESEIG